MEKKNLCSVLHRVGRLKICGRIHDKTMTNDVNTKLIHTPSGDAQLIHFKTGQIAFVMKNRGKVMCDMDLGTDRVTIVRCGDSSGEITSYLFKPELALHDWNSAFKELSSRYTMIFLCGQTDLFAVCGLWSSLVMRDLFNRVVSVAHSVSFTDHGFAVVNWRTSFCKVFPTIRVDRRDVVLSTPKSWSTFPFELALLILLFVVLLCRIQFSERVVVQTLNSFSPQDLVVSLDMHLFDPAHPPSSEEIAAMTPVEDLIRVMSVLAHLHGGDTFEFTSSVLVVPELYHQESDFNDRLDRVCRGG